MRIRTGLKEQPQRVEFTAPVGQPPRVTIRSVEIGAIPSPPLLPVTPSSSVHSPCVEIGIKLYFEQWPIGRGLLVTTHTRNAQSGLKL